jgi:hypothetical protein
VAARKRPPPPDPLTGLTISPAMIKWAVSIIGALLGAIVLWWQVWDRVEVHWRLEAIQKAKDDKVDADIKAATMKAETELKAAVAKLESDFGRYKESDARSGAWTLYVVQDFRAAAETRWAQECVDKKRPADVCHELAIKAEETRQRAKEQRAIAMDASKGKP